jgi:hypothetical protein
VNILRDSNPKQKTFENRCDDGQSPKDDEVQALLLDFILFFVAITRLNHLLIIYLG